MKIAIIGAGYVGLVTGVSLATLGHKVVCIEIDPDKVSTINQGKSPFFEEGLDLLLKKMLKKGLFRASLDFEKNVVGSDVTIIAVGTPTIDNNIDLSYIKKAAEQIGLALSKTKKYQVVTVKSTVLPGVTQEVVKPILEKFSKKRIGQFGLCMNPEFLQEGSALKDALHPDRIVIGQIDSKSGQTFAKIYKKVTAPIVFTNLSTAEMTKYSANALFATLISYANEIARISEMVQGVDVVDVWKGVHLDRRLSPFYKKARIRPGVLSFILSGCGYGGSCFPKDTKAIASFADQIGAQASLIKTVIDINKTQPERIIFLLKNALGKNLRNKKIAVLGLSFKPNTDDIRESVSFSIIEKLLSEKAKITCHDPMVYKEKIPQQLQDLNLVLADSAKDAIKDVDAVIVVTSWEEYIKLTPKFFKQNMTNPIVIDGRRIYDKHAFESAGIIYKGIGL